MHTPYKKFETIEVVTPLVTNNGYFHSAIGMKIIGFTHPKKRPHNRHPKELSPIE